MHAICENDGQRSLKSQTNPSRLQDAQDGGKWTLPGDLSNAVTAKNRKETDSEPIRSGHDSGPGLSQIGL